MNINIINNRIKKEICYNTINKLTDISLFNDYKKCKSVKKKIYNLELILDKHDIENKYSIIYDYLSELIPAGTKSIIRGKKFNNIVQDKINSLNLDKKRFDICFEEKCKINITDEIPDWFILDKNTNKILIGMNQIDIWSGGHQLNRGNKYLIDNKHNTEKSKLLCVICNEIQFTNTKRKVYNLFETGYTNNTLCYINNIETIINEYFNSV
jgi:hypothetical protein